MTRPANSLKPFWRYYGGKWRAAPLYPAPLHDVIVEPFAGAAGYACNYPDHRVVLVEKYPVIAGIWRYLIAVSAAEVRRYADLDGEATWFIDPPYVGAKGAYYMAHGWGARTSGTPAIDYAALGAWCRSRQGQVIVCENDGATWLPFRPHRTVRGGFLGRPASVEVIWP